MVVTRISTYNTHQATRNNASSVQNTLLNLQKQISSGFKTDDFKGLSGAVEGFVALDNKISRTDGFLQNNQILSARMQTMNTSVNQVIDTATALRNTLLLRRNQSIGQSVGFAGQLQSTWETLTGQLNTNLEGRYLFGGIRTDTPPVDNTTFPTIQNADLSPEDGYYRGAKESTVMRVQDDYNITQSVRADDPAFQKIFSAMAIAKEGDATNDDELLKRAYDMLSDGIAELGDVQTAIGNTLGNMEVVADRQSQLILYWKSVKESLINTDLVSASTEVATNQGILQASFQAFARINSLQLSDFLR
jgi:flagellar hook-associated protein 3 FlgL